MMRSDSAKNRAHEGQKMLEEQLKMQTILEMDAEDRFVDNLTSNIYVDNPERSLPRGDPHTSVSSNDEDVGKAGSQVPYRSYRGLSDIKELSNLLTLADKRKSSSKSNEMLIRKSLVLGGSSPLLIPKDRMRAVRSCENMAKPRGSIELDDFAVKRENQPRVLIQSIATRKKQGSSEVSPLINLRSSGSDCSKSRESGLVKETNSASHLENTPYSSTHKIPFDSPINTLDSNKYTTMQDEDSCCGTLRSRNTSSLSESNTLLYENQEEATGEPCLNMLQKSDRPGDEDAMPLAADCLQEGTNRSHEDIIDWLQRGADDDDDDAQSVSSVEYRSSMCSSTHDFQNGDLPSCRSSLSSTSKENTKKSTRINAPKGMRDLIVIHYG